MSDKYRQLPYPRQVPDGDYRPEPYGSPQRGKYYRVKYKDEEYFGFLDHVARMYGGAVLGFIYTPEGEAVKGIPVTKYAQWFRKGLN